MSPRTTFLFALAGVILVGLPLPVLTATPSAPPAAAPEAGTPRRTIYATLRHTGAPLHLRLRSERNAAWQEMPCDVAVQEMELELPLSGMLEIEVQAEWAGNEPQAVTLTLEPDGCEARSATEWKEEGSSTLHSIMRFTW